MAMSSLRTQMIRLAHAHPELRGDLLPLLKAAQSEPAGVRAVAALMEASAKQKVKRDNKAIGTQKSPGPEWAPDAPTPKQTQDWWLGRVTIFSDGARWIVADVPPNRRELWGSLVYHSDSDEWFRSVSSKKPWKEKGRAITFREAKRIAGVWYQTGGY